MITEAGTGYREEIGTDGIPAEQYLDAAKMAAIRLYWAVAAATPDTFIFLTPGDGYYYPGEQITISVHDKTVVFHSISIDGSLNDDKHRHNAALFRQAVTVSFAEMEKAERNRHPMHRERYGALLVSKTYTVTPVIVYLNFFIFLLMVLAGLSPISPNAEELYRWGGNFGPAVHGGEWWRLVSYIFLHGGFMHLFMNTFGLLYIGMYLEPLLGRFRFGAAYLLTGICAGLLSIIVHKTSVGVGASGAIFGMYGVFLSMLTTDHLQKTVRRTMIRSLLFFILLNLLYGLQGNTDNAAHIGGLLSGIVIGYVYYPGVAAKATLFRQLLTTLIITATVIVAAITILRFE